MKRAAKRRRVGDDDLRDGARKARRKKSGRAKPSELGASTQKKHAKMAPNWAPGQSGNPKGRPKGSRNKLGEAFLDALQADFDVYGVEAIQTVREERPHEYLKVVASILPKELNVNTNALADISDEDLATLLDHVRSLVVAGAPGPVATGEGSQAIN